MSAIVLPFPDLREPAFANINGVLCERSNLGAWEAITDTEAAAISLELRRLADQYANDGQMALALLHKDWLQQLSRAWVAYGRATA